MNIILWIILVFGIGVFFYVFVPGRIFVLNIFKALFYLPYDVFLYFKHKTYNNAPIGFIDMYTGLFGRGKTLSAVHKITAYYHRYNNVPVWDPATKSLVPQYVNILSNVVLSIPYQKFVSMEQIVDVAKNHKQYEEDNHCKVVTVVLIDEASTQLNSRRYKDNFSTPMLNALLTCRHARMGFVLTSQRFGHCDALMRQVTSKVIECKKIWRLQCQFTYDAWDLENAGSPTQLKPIFSGGFFVTNKDYAAYDTTAVVDDLVKDYEAGNFLSDDQVLALRGESVHDIDNVRHLSRKAKKRRNKAS